MTTQMYASSGRPDYEQAQDTYQSKNVYVSSRRSSSSSTSSHTGRVVARPHSHMPTNPSSSFSSLGNERTEVLASSQPDFQSYQLSGQRPGHLSVPSPSKGKQRASSVERPATMFNIGEQAKKESRSGWMIDEESGSAGMDAWVERDRVILVIGRPSPDSLSPLLYNPQYASTLLLIALSSPSPAFTQLAAQTMSERTTYPIVQLIDLKAIANNNPSHPLPSLLEKAAKIAVQWRSSSSGSSTSRMSWMGTGSRRSSSTSISSAAPRVSPPMDNRSRLAPPSSFPRRASQISCESPKDSMSERRMSSPSLRSDASRRKSSFFGLGKTTESKASPPASPFDAVLHFVPSSTEFTADRALQEMLQRSILLTSAIVPILAKRDMSNSKDSLIDITPVSLIHIIPSNPPAALPAVLENFILSLLPSFQAKSERTLASFVVNEAAWLYPPEKDLMSGADILLFGAAKVRPTERPDGTTRTKSRAYIPYWPHQGPPMVVASNPDFTRPDYSTMVAIAPPDKPAPRRPGGRSPPTSRPSTRGHRSGLSQVLLPSDFEDVSSLLTPELDHAPSSASSQSHEAVTPRASTYGSEVGSPSPIDEEPVKESGKKSGGFGSFVKRFGKKKQ